MFIYTILGLIRYSKQTENQTENALDKALEEGVGSALTKDIINAVTKDIITDDKITKDLITKDIITGDKITKDLITKDIITGDKITKDLIGDITIGSKSSAVSKGYLSVPSLMSYLSKTKSSDILIYTTAPVYTLRKTTIRDYTTFEDEKGNFLYSCDETNKITMQPIKENEIQCYQYDLVKNNKGGFYLKNLKGDYINAGLVGVNRSRTRNAMSVFSFNS